MILMKIIYQIQVQCKKIIYACLNFCQAFHLWKPRFSPWHCIQRLVIQIYIPIKPFVWLCWIENEPIKHPRQTILGKIILKSWSKHWTSNKPLKGIEKRIPSFLSCKNKWSWSWCIHPKLFGKPKCKGPNPSTKDLGGQKPLLMEKLRLLLT